MNKAYIFFAAVTYVALKIKEIIFGESDIYTIGVASILALFIFSVAIVKNSISAFGAIILIFPILIVITLLILRHFFQLELVDWMIWAAGLASGVLCLGYFQPHAERRS